MDSSKCPASAIFLLTQKSWGGGVDGWLGVQNTRNNGVFLCCVVCVCPHIFYISILIWCPISRTTSFICEPKHASLWKTYCKLTTTDAVVVLGRTDSCHHRLQSTQRAHLPNPKRCTNLARQASFVWSLVQNGKKTNCQFKMKNLDNNKRNANVSKRPLCTFSCLVSCLRLRSSFTGCK